MTSGKRKTEFEPGRGYSEKDWDDVSDNPEWTEDDFAKAVPFTEAHPELAASLRRGRPKADAPKQLTTLRLDAEVLDRLRASGPGWQTRVNAALRKLVGLKP